MPSWLHEAFLELFRNRPELAPELLRDCLGVELPGYTEARLDSADFTQLAPTEYRADLVVLLVDGKPVLGIVVEAQLRKKARKRFTWPLYAAALRARLECDTCVLVVTPSDDVANWAAQPSSLGPRSSFAPLVIGPSGVPVIVDTDRAELSPELAVLSVMAHGQGDAGTAARIAAAAASGARRLEGERALVYWDLIWAALSEAARKEFTMIREGYQFKSDFARRYFAEGKAEGKAAGIAEGQAKGRAAALLELLDARGLAVSESQRNRITSCTDLALLTVWLRRAASADSTDDVFR